MKRTLLAFAAAAFAAVIPARAAMVYSVSFTGTVYSTQGTTGKSVGNIIMGHFDLNDTTGQFLDFSINGVSAPAGSSSSNTGLNFFNAVYDDQLSSVATGGNVNSDFNLNLSALTQWPLGTDTIYTLLTDHSQIPGNLDTSGDFFTSTFGYYTSDAAGSNVVSLDADLTSLSVTASPEPAGFALLGLSLVGLGMILRRRRP